MNNVTVAVNRRNYGIDLLRIVSMLMVVVLHILGQGGVLKTAERLSLGYESAWFLEIICYCAVNCYALISGYVGVDAKYKYSNIAYIWLQVVFYAVGIAFVAALISPEIYVDAVLEGITPVCNNFYWYFTAYFCIFFFIPVFNKLINALGEKQLKILGVTVFMLFCILQLLAKREVFYTNRGYSALWLALLYILGGILKRTGMLQKVKGYKLLIGFFAVCFITWLEKYIVDYSNVVSKQGEPIKNTLLTYTSPTILLAAVMLLALFSKMKIGGKAEKIISFFAPLSFGVYLIHVQKQVWEHLLKDLFVPFAQLHWAVLPIAVIGTATAIFVACALIDYLRDKIFKLLKIKKLFIKLEEKFLGKIWE